MGAGCFNSPDYPSFSLSTEKKEGLDVYYNRYGIIHSHSLNFFSCPICSHYFNEEEKKKLKPIFDSLADFNPDKFSKLNEEYNDLIKSKDINIFPKLQSIGKKFENANNVIEKHKYLKYTCCADNNKKCYLKLWNYHIPKLIVDENLDQRYHYDIWKNNGEIKKILNDRRRSDISQEEIIEQIMEEWEQEKLDNSEFTYEDLQYFARSQVNCIPYFNGSPSQLTTVFNYVTYSHNLNYVEKKLFKKIVASYAGSNNDEITFMNMEQNQVKMTTEENRDLLKFIQNYEAKLGL